MPSSATPFCPHFSNPCYGGLHSHTTKKTFINPANWKCYFNSLGTIYQCHFLRLPQFFLSKEPYAFLSHFKSKGISVFLTHHKGQASLENNLHPLGSIFFQNLGVAKHEPFMLVKRNIAYSGSLNE